MKSLKLTQGFVAQVDNEDFENVKSIAWHVRKARNTQYAQHTYRDGGKVKAVDLHRYILKITDSKVEVDHKDHNGLNCQRKNLRVATHAQNLCNTRKYKNNTSGHKGVSWKKASRRWQVRVMVNKRHVYIGEYKNKREACTASDEALQKYHGEFNVGC